MKPLLIAIALVGTVAACSVKTETVQRPAPQPTTVVAAEVPASPPPTVVYVPR